MSDTGQFNINFDQVPHNSHKPESPKSHQDYSPEETTRLGESIISKRKNKEALTEEEQAFDSSDFEFWAKEDDNPFKK